VRTNLVVESGLGERGLVGLVVPVPAVPDEIDEEVLPEFRAIFDAQPRDSHAEVGVLGV